MTPTVTKQRCVLNRSILPFPIRSSCKIAFLPTLAKSRNHDFVTSWWVGNKRTTKKVLPIFFLLLVNQCYWEVWFTCYKKQILKKFATIKLLLNLTCKCLVQFNIEMEVWEVADIGDGSQLGWTNILSWFFQVFPKHEKREWPRLYVESARFLSS